MNKRTPSGFIATCQCGAVVGAMDFERTERSEASKLLGGWLHRGCTVTPKFDYTWSVTVESCRCGESSALPASEGAKVETVDLIEAARKSANAWTAVDIAGDYHGDGSYAESSPLVLKARRADADLYAIEARIMAQLKGART